MKPRSDDVLISNRRATPEHDISVGLGGRHVMTCAGREPAFTEGRKLAEARRVDLWATDDQTHFVLITSHREPEVG